MYSIKLITESNVPKDEAIVLPFVITKLALQVTRINAMVNQFTFAAILNPLLIVRMFGTHITAAVMAPKRMK
ncbi:carbamoyl-phosphate synthase large subunit [Vibrio campbellii]|nr:carbamoyl-phosphate synthase large subunit [Vibrio campbellii]